MTGIPRIPECYTRIQYAGETDEQFRARCEAIEAHNAEAARIEKAWAPGPAKFYEKWCRKYAPHLLGES